MPRHITPPTPEEDTAITAAANAAPDARPFTDAEWEQVKPLVRRGHPIGNSVTPIDAMCFSPHRAIANA